MSGTWTKQGEEPTLETFFADPIVDLLLRRDGLTVQDVWQAIDRARSGGTSVDDKSATCSPRMYKAA